MLTRIAGLVALGCLALSAGCGPRGEAATGVDPHAGRDGGVLPSPGMGGVSIADVVERAIPSVVNIALTKRGEPPPPAAGPGGGKRAPHGLGSGVAVAPGIVLTNNHVVAEAEEIRITTYDRRELTATVVGTDPKSDLAVLRIQGDASALRPIELGDSSRLRLGDVVIAIGNPFGVGQTVTMGIVSAMGRAEMGIVDYEDFIQTDAAINPGNSGGALVDMEGRLVGINTAILSRTGSSVGIGFAIPMSMARPIMESLLKTGRVVRGWLGVSIQDVDPELAKALGLPKPTGALISDVDPAGPAAKAGLQRGDVVLRVDGAPAESASKLRNAVALLGAKRGVRLEILRQGKTIAVTVDLAELPGESGPATPMSGALVDGVTMSDVTPELRERFGLPPELQQGALVTAIEPNSQAARAGLRAGDVILEVNRQRVESVARFGGLWGAAKGRTLLLVLRGGGTFFLIVQR
ncbi:MAG: Do family serine endopeptidase [Polyangiaceae bacterium]|nr:Do family serine endopeptidase [Polyangiaceae bacterium]